MTPKMEICLAALLIIMGGGLIIGTIDFTVWEIKRTVRRYFFRRNVALRK